MKIVEFFKFKNGKSPVEDWLNSLSFDFRMRIIKRLQRIEEGNFGDYKKLDNELSELRFNFGSGYRIYYFEADNIVVILLNASDKKQQSKDIKKAKEYLKI